LDQDEQTVVIIDGLHGVLTETFNTTAITIQLNAIQYPVNRSHKQSHVIEYVNITIKVLLSMPGGPYNSFNSPGRWNIKR